MISTKSPEAIYSDNVPLSHRKKYAQFFTPPIIADIMVSWLLGNDKLHLVLEPAFGLGIFSRTLLSKSNSDLTIKGFDIDKLIHGEAQKMFAQNNNVNILLQDYMYNDWNNTYDGIICNPPYFKFHDYDNKSIIAEIEKRLACKLNGFTNLYTLFLLKSIHQLKLNGRCAYIIPSEFLNSDYGKLVKMHLIKTRTLRYIIVFDFKENVFDDSVTTSCIILCANDNKSDYVQFINVHTKKELVSINDIISSYPIISRNSHTFGTLNPEKKWRTYYDDNNKRQPFQHLVPFSKYAKVMRGIATGSNAYFTFNISKAHEYGIDEKYLLPCICRSADIKGITFSSQDFNTLKEQDKKVFLLNAQGSNDANVATYITKGEYDGINKKYLTASRNPWYAIEKRQPAPIWVTVFNRKGLRFVRNYTEAANLTTFHCVYPRNGLFPSISIDLLFAYLLTETAHKIFESNAREYGNGLRKFEPNDLNKGLMLDIELLPDRTKMQIESLYQKYISLGDLSFIQQIDKILIEYFAL